MMNPPSTDLINGFSVYSKNEIGLIEEKQFSMQINEPGTLNLNIEINDFQINAINDYAFSINCLNPIDANSSLYLEFGGGANLNNAQVLGIFGLNFFSNFEVIGSQIFINNQINQYLVENTTIILLVKNVENPSQSGLQSIHAAIKSSYGGEICKGITQLTYTPIYLKQVSLYPASLFINQVTNYTFILDLSSISNEINYMIRITFPKGILFSNPKCDLPQICLFLYPQVTVGWFEFQEIVTVKIEGIQNANTTADTEAFLIQIISNDTNQNVLAQNSDIGLRFNPGIISGSAVSSSYVCGEISNFTISAVLSNVLSTNSSISIVIPSEISLTPESSVTNLIGFSKNSQVLLGNNSVLINNAFDSVFSYNVKITLNYLVNPISVCESSSFVVQTFFNSALIDSSQNQFTIKMNTPNLISLSITSSSYVVGKISSYLFSISTNNFIQNTIKIYIPDDISLNHPICTSISPVLSSISCFAIDQVLEISLNLIDLNAKVLQFKVDGFLNSIFLEKPASFTLQTLKNSYLVDQGSAYLTMTVPGSLFISVLPNTTLPNSPLSLNILLNYSNLVPVSGYLLMNFSVPYSIPYNAYCNVNCEFQSNSIFIDPISNLSIFNLRSPQSSASEITFFFSTVSSNSFARYVIDTSSLFSYSVLCSENCLSCEFFYDFCTKCASPFILYNNSCVASCPSGFGVLSNTNSCGKCSDLCESCFDSAYECTSCYTDYFLYNGTCQSECPSLTTVIQNKTCVDCDENCLTCERASENCTSCEKELILYMSQCFKSCPLNSANISGVCEPCVCSNETLGNGVCDEECNTLSCNFDNGDCANQINVKSLPTITAGVGTVAVTSVSKAAGGGNMMGSTLAVWGLTQTCSWISMAYSINSHKSSGRRLSEGHSVDIVFGILVALLVSKFLLNLVFTLIYFAKYVQHDHLHYQWMNSHKFFVSLIAILAGTFSFHLIRLTYSGPKFFKCCKGEFFKISTIYVLLIVYTVTTLVIIIIPAIGVLAYALVLFYNKNNDIYIQTIDCLSLTILMAITTVFDLVSMSLEVGKEMHNPRTNSILPLNRENSKVAEETFETKFDEIVLTNKLKNLEKNDHSEPEIEESFIDNTQPMLRLGDLMKNIEEIDTSDVNPDEFCSNLWVVLYKPLKIYLLLKENPENIGDSFEFVERFKNSKIIDIKHPIKGWCLGRRLKEYEFKVLSTAKTGPFDINAYHISTGFNLVVYASFAGSFLNDLATGTALSKSLTEEDSKKVKTDPDNLYIGTVTIEGNEYRARRRFNDVIVLDVFHPTKDPFDVSFTGDFEIIDKEPDLREDDVKLKTAYSENPFHFEKE